MTSVQELYETAVRTRPPSERLQLAAMILNDIEPRSVVDYSETWADEDIAASEQPISVSSLLPRHKAE